MAWCNQFSSNRRDNMDRCGLVSIITPFYNTDPHFLNEAISSVLDQSYPHWQLLLVDDGSIGECTEVARHYADQYSDRISYLVHDEHRNCGMSASRNLGIVKATGEYLAFLDADDVWLPETLSEQVSILASQPTAAMLYGNTEYWYSWTGLPADRQRDFRPKLGIAADSLFYPPALVPLFLSGAAAVPCTCSLLVRRRAVTDARGGFEPAFRNLYEDQVFYFKICLQSPVYVASQSWGRYRQHEGMSTSIELSQQAAVSARLVFLRWVESYLRACGVRDAALWQELRQQMWLCSHRPGSGQHVPAPRTLRQVKKWLLRLQRQVLPSQLQRWLWLRGAFDD